MANDVSIIVSADLGDTLVKLDLAKHAVNDLGDASENTAAKQDAAAVSTGFFDTALTGLNDAMTASIPLFGGMEVPLIVLPVVAGAAAAAVVALADALGTVIAIAAAFVAPLTLVTGLLGSLGLGFALAAKKAFGMHEDGLGQAIGGLKNQFNDLTTTLVGRFMPVFQFLIHNAHDALDFLGRIAKLPLDDAFKKLATQGVPAVEKFLGEVGHMLAHPIRLAFQIAFGTGKGGNEVATAVSHLWNQLSDFLFGYTKTHFLRLDGRVFKISQQHVDGIFQPLIDWFNRHDFTKEGIKLGHQILAGFINSGASKRLGQFLVTVLGDAINTVEHHMVRALGTDAVSFIVGHWKQISTAISNLINPLSHVVSFIESRWGGAISNIAQRITGAIGGAINTVVGIANRFLDVLQQIAGFFSQVFTFHVNWPSPPSWLSAVLGGLGGGSSGSTAGRTGQGGNNGPSFRQGGNVVQHNTFHLTGSGSHAAFSRQVREIGRELARQQHILAGGA
jgi:hypothetical protein